MSILEDYDNYHFPGLEKRNKKHPRITYVNMRLMINKYMQPWVKNFEKAFKLLDKTNRYNTVILLKADDCTINEKSIIVQNMKEIMLIDK